MNQSELAERCSITQTSLSQIERGNKNPSQKTLDKICKELEVPVSLLYVLGMTEEDVPMCRRAIYRQLFPSMMSLMKELIYEVEEEFAMAG